MDLIKELDGVLEEAIASIQRDPDLGGIFSGRTTRETYLRFLEQTYHYVRYTPSTIRTAALALKTRSEPYYVALGDALLHHADEEGGHEEWVLNDVRALGGDADAVVAATPNPAVQAYIADARFTVTSRHPIGVFGEGYILEGLAQRLACSAAAQLEQRSGIPHIERAVSFLRSHGEIDEDHLREMRAALSPLQDEREKRAILRRARSTADQYEHILYYR